MILSRHVALLIRRAQRDGRSRLHARLPVCSRRLRLVSKTLPRGAVHGFPRWRPLSLRWKSARREAQRVVSRGGTVVHHSIVAMDCHMRFHVMTGAALELAITRDASSAERTFQSSAKRAPTPLRYSQRDAGRHALPSPIPREPMAPLPRAVASGVPPSRSTAISLTRRVSLDLQELRRTPRPHAPTLRVPSWPCLLPPVMSAAMPMTLACPNQRWQPVSLSWQRIDAVAGAASNEPKARATFTEAFFSTPELVWRKVAPHGTHDAVEDVAPPEYQMARASGIESIATTAAIARAPSMQAPALAGKPTALCDLDPCLLDRLADDVIRRVERRARIERERRGL